MFCKSWLEKEEHWLTVVVSKGLAGGSHEMLPVLHSVVCGKDCHLLTKDVGFYYLDFF